MIVPFNDFKKEYASSKKQINESMQGVAASGWYILGKEVSEFEEKFAKFLRSGYGIGVANGLEALQIALLALDMKPGEEVITTPLSAVATALAIRAAGGKPVFVDIDEFLHLDANKIEGVITKRTRAIIPVHLFGNPCDMQKIMRLAKKRKLAVIEDCAQAHGALFNGKMVGTFGMAGAFSFYPTKNLGALGDGGAIVTSDQKLAGKYKMLRNYGQRNRYEHAVLGINSRLDELQAAILSVKLKTLEKNNNRRRIIAEIYKKNLVNIPNLKVIGERKGGQSVWHLFVIETEERDGLQKFLKNKKIDTLIHYPIPLHKQECFKEYNGLSLPVVEQKVKNIISLPINPYLTDVQIKYVCRCIKEFYNLKTI
jgi:dTDP-4-amino-4,6-dideoxygalactose transaminase